jgi:hypothetical protein
MTRCAYRTCRAAAEHRLRIVPDGGAGRQGRVAVCSEHAAWVRRDAGRIMAACLAYLEEGPAAGYHVVDDLPVGVAPEGRAGDG